MKDNDLTVLALDTSSKVVSIAIVSSESLMAEHFTEVKEGSCSEILMPLIDRVIKGSGLTVGDIDGFGVGCGPGSFTGLRIGIGTIKGLAFACRRPVVGISSMDAISMNVPYTERPICSMIDARMGEVYAAIYRFDNGKTIKRVTDIMAVHPQILIDKIKEDTLFLGSGAILYSAIIEEALESRAEFLAEELSFPRASVIGRLAQKEIFMGHGMEAGDILPLYIRPSQAELKWGNGWFKKTI